MTMAFQGGFLNTGGFMACHHFVSHVTGYGTLLPIEIEQSGLFPALAIMVIPICFLLGSSLSGYLVDIPLQLHRRPKYYIAFGLICFLIGLVLVLGNAGAFGLFGSPFEPTNSCIVLAVLAFVCGIQNGTITTVSNSVIRTTHLTGITTDLGIGLMRFLYRRNLAEKFDDEAKANFMRIGIITCFVAGSFAGYKIFSSIGYRGFIVPLLTSGSLFVAMMYFARSRSSTLADLKNIP